MSMHTPETLYVALGALNIPYVDHHHAAVFTVAEGHGITDHLKGAHIKNLFVKDKAKNLYLITALQDRMLNLNALAKHLGTKDRVSFCDEETLYGHLGVTPGSVTPLALINAKPGSMRFILDSGILEHEKMYAHPLINSQSTEMAPEDLVKAVTAWGYAPELLDLGLFPRA